MLSRSIIALFAVALLLVIPMNESISHEEKALLKVRMLNGNGIREFDYKIGEKRVLELINKIGSSEITSDEKYQILIEFLEREIHFPAKNFIEVKKNLFDNISLFIFAGWGETLTAIDAIWLFFVDYFVWFIENLFSFLPWKLIQFLYYFLSYLFPIVHHLLFPVKFFIPFFICFTQDAHLWIIEKDGYKLIEIKRPSYTDGLFFTGCWIEINIHCP